MCINKNTLLFNFYSGTYKMKNTYRIGVRNKTQYISNI